MMGVPGLWSCASLIHFRRALTKLSGLSMLNAMTITSVCAVCDRAPQNGYEMTAGYVINIEHDIKSGYLIAKRLGYLLTRLPRARPGAMCTNPTSCFAETTTRAAVNTLEYTPDSFGHLVLLRVKRDC